MQQQVSFPTDYNSILERLNNINPLQYARSRNFLTGSITYLSPYISRGVISTKQIYEAVIARNYKRNYIYKFVQQLAWRDFFQLTHKALGEKINDDIKHVQPDYIHNKIPTAVINAVTGIKAIDHYIRLLIDSGYMHNHVRMYTASVTCNVGKSYWQQPAQWLYYYLLDGDIASNNCSWQWVAGSFSTKKYYCNQENINRYTGGEQHNTFLDKPYPELVRMDVPSVLQSTTDINLVTALPKGKPVKIDIHKPTCIYNAYNLDPFWRKEEDVNRILLLEPSHYSKYPVDKKIIDFVIALSSNIKNIQLHVGEINDILKMYKDKETATANIISKEHPAFNYPGIKDERDWLFPELNAFYKSYSSFWKKAEKLFLAG